MRGAVATLPGQLLPEEIASWLAVRIQDNTLAPGALIPSERQLTEQFSVSRAVVREALARLKSEGLIVTKQGSGAFVAERGSRHSFRLQDVALDEKVAQAHILEFLITIEVAATRLAALRRGADDLKRIRRALIGMEYAIAHDRLGDEEDFTFHQAIVDAAGNPHFKALNEYLENSVRRLIRQARSNTAIKYSDSVLAVQGEHQAIYDAIVAGNGDAAAIAAETHLRNAAKRLDMYLDGAAKKPVKARTSSQAARQKKIAAKLARA